MLNILEECKKANLKLHKIGEGLWRGYCPFHKDTGTPNFTVYEETDSFYCWACNKAGDIVKFLMYFYDISWDEADKRVHSDSILERVKHIFEKQSSKNINYIQTLHKVYGGIFYDYLIHKDNNKIMKVMKKFDFELSNKENLTYQNFKILFKVFLEKLANV